MKLAPSDISIGDRVRKVQDLVAIARAMPISSRVEIVEEITELVAGMSDGVLEVALGVKSKRNGFVYVFATESRSAFKIGWAADVMNRLIQIQSMNHERLSCLASVAGTQKDERRLQRLARKYHIHGEWFRWNDGFVESLPQLMEIWA